MRRLLALLVAFLAVACSGGARVDDGALARSSVLYGEDLGEGWRSFPSIEGQSLHHACEDTTSGTTARVDSRRFLRGRRAVEDQVSVWVDERAAHAFLERTSRAGTAACQRRHLIRSGREFYDVVEVTVEPVEVARYGDEVVARRFHIESSDTEFTASSYVDAVFVRSGRVVAAFTFVRSGAPYDSSRDAVVRAVLQRIGGRDALA